MINDAIQHIEDACRAACEAIGVIYKPVPSDGQFHVIDAIDGKKSNGAGRLKFFADGQGGIVHNWKTGQQQAFFVNGKSGETIAPQELERIKREQRKRAAEQLKRQNWVARKALAIWKAAKPAPPDHPYLTRKQIKPHGARVGTWTRSIQDDSGKFRKIVIENCLILPMYNEAGELRSLQAIFPEHNQDLDRGKDFLPGGGLAGLFWWIGPRTETVLICEGFATGATLYEESGYRVYMAFTANNLMAVGCIVREKLPDAKLVFAADNDTKTANNPGLTKATEAAQAVGGSVAVPEISGDFNDYAIFLRELNNDTE